MMQKIEIVNINCRYHSLIRSKSRQLFPCLALLMLGSCVSATHLKNRDSEQDGSAYGDSDVDTATETEDKDTGTTPSTDSDTDVASSDEGTDSEPSSDSDTGTTDSTTDTEPDSGLDSESEVSSDTEIGEKKIILVVDAPNDTNTVRRKVNPGDGTQWPNTVSQTFDHSTGGQSAASLTGTLYVSGTDFFETSHIPARVFNGDYAGDMIETHSATWTVTGYPQGKQVDIYGHWPSQANFASAAPCSINGAGPVYLSLKTAPASDLVLNDGTKNVNFQKIATVNADQTGQVQVILSGQAGAWAPVDAMAFVSLP